MKSLCQELTRLMVGVAIAILSIIRPRVEIGS